MTSEAQQRSGDKRADSDLVNKLQAAANLASSMSEGSHGSSTSSPVPISWQGAAPKPTLLLRRSYCVTVTRQLTDCLQQLDQEILENIEMLRGLEQNSIKKQLLSSLTNLMTAQKLAIFCQKSMHALSTRLRSNEQAQY